MEIIRAITGPATCAVPVASMRESPSHKAEIVSQLVFGEACQVIDHGFDYWCRIVCDYDGYEGWCQRDQLRMHEDGSIQTLAGLTLEWVSRIVLDGQAMMIPFGSYINNQEHERTVVWNPSSNKVSETDLLRFAFTFLNTAYLWGGKSVFGVDCSGFVQTIFKFLNVPILRDASQQATQGESIGFLQETRCGDLAFFDNEEGRITHVGLLLNDHEIIHSSVKVRVDDIDNYGIINRDSGLRTHKLRVIKRYFELEELVV